jgi:hypothetical protein
MEPVYICHHLNSRISFGNYEIDDVMFLIVPFMLWLNLHLSFLVGAAMLLSGWFCMNKWSEFKLTKLRGFKQHFLYRFGFTKPATFPPSYIKETIGN